ncbi:peptidylprolyl isomerase [Streptomyces mashuensis]|uniref:peptidylprolyl isomerase n=1 Tax=Streptomyces mashuensis TaxID=33904 RepID=A0A919ECL8_9ACTN|nr:FKBP-type peptidyl-prolyl cis-trans isomerase [Streptomyces mashuensis]GHF40218.1 peptidylprolyl isomerase [Streptomyces mashuensis]
MNHAKNVRRLAAALAVPVLLLTASACGSDDGGGKVSVEGKFGEKPTVSVPKGAKPADEPVVKALSEGRGEKVEKGSFIRIDYAVYSMKDGRELINSWNPQMPPGKPAGGARPQEVLQVGQQGQQVPAKVGEALAGQRAGSRVLLEGTVKSLVAEAANPRSGFAPGDGLVWVVDVLGARKVDAKSEAKGEQAAPEQGMPVVKAPSQKPAEITVPKDEKPPADLKEQVLIKGSGPEVKAGEGLIAQYTGVKWEDGAKFDSSWDHAGATAFQIGTGSVVQGWDKGLVGKHVGDRVLLVIPPKLGYGNQEGSELQKNTLVFVVDILGTV